MMLNKYAKRGVGGGRPALEGGVARVVQQQTKEMEQLSLGVCLVSFHTTYHFAPVQLQPVQLAEPSSPSHSYKHSQLTISNDQDIPTIILDRQDLLKINYRTNKKAWTEEEDSKLVECREQRQMEWEEIAALLPNRNPKMCYSRYKRLLEGTKLLWRHKDDEKLKRLIQELGQDWKEIQKYFKQRNARQIKQHYDYYLRPNLDNQQWTIEEDLQLIDFVNRHGKEWSISQQFFPSKSLSHIKNRFYGRLNKLNEEKLLAISKGKEGGGGALV